MFLSAGVLFFVVFLVLARVLANFSVRHVDAGAFWAVCTTGFHLFLF